MQLICPHCQHSLEFNDERPRFCSYCGQSLSTVSSDPGTAPTIVKPSSSLERTGEFQAGNEILPVHGLETSHSEEMPKQVGDYKLLRRIGGGGMGSVFEAEDSNSGRRVALKLIKPEFALSQIAVERFRLEGRLASSISHPRCVFVLSAEEVERRPYIVMELMPGATLADLVQERGALPVNEAIAKILDVIEGLQEAHRIGVIHRDVKPSNCFLDVDGRVKIGDFGLAKMAANDVDLTRTGTFLGTPLFSSPEQIKRQPLTVQADIYSVCATLYYLLTGQAPFAGGDAMAAVARIVSEDAPPLRNHRPEVPKSLERIVLKGLDRDPDNRWNDLESLRLALVRFLPGNVTRGGLALRFGAYLIDVAILKIIIWFIAQGIFGFKTFENPEKAFGKMTQMTLETFVIEAFFWFLYFGVLESLTGWTLGKRILRLRTCLVGAIDPPGLVRGLVRFLIFFNLIHLGNWTFLLLLAILKPSTPTLHLSFGDYLMLFLISIAPNVAFLIGLGALLYPMRERSGYRGLHELASKTRVVELPPPPRKRVFMTCQCEVPMFRRPEMPTQIGPYMIEGVVQWRHDEQTLVGHDPTLGRRVWVWVRSIDSQPLDPRRRDLNRSSRLRHVASGTDETNRWDAFLAPSGTPLPDLVKLQGRLQYADAIVVFDQIVEELSRSCKEGTVPEVLSPRQVFVDSRGHVQILGTALDDVGAPIENDEQRCLELLRQSAAILLEGKPCMPQCPPRYRAPMPRYARVTFDQLLDRNAPPSLFHLRDEIKQLTLRPLEVSRPRRFLHLCLATVRSVGLFLLLWAFIQLGPTFMVNTELTVMEMRDKVLETSTIQNLAVATLQPTTEARLGGTMAAMMERQTLERDGQAKAQMNDWLDARLKWTFLPLSDVMDAQSTNLRNSPFGGVPKVRISDRYLLWREWPEFLGIFQPNANLAWIVPSIFAIGGAAWAFGTRGGFAFRLLGLEPLRLDGRPAARWQCALRVLLFWAPQILLLGGALWIDAYYWSNWSRALQGTGWQPWLAWILWWAGIAIMPALLLAALWKPDRGWNDRIVGTVIVPR